MSKGKPIPEYVLDTFVYDETSPTCLRYIDGRVAGKILKSKKTNLEYYVVFVNPCKYMAHRIVWTKLNGVIEDGSVIDHIDGNGLNNNRNNLRVVTPRTNSQNKRKQRDNTSGVTGVYLNIKKDKTGSPIEYWMASWIDDEKVQRTKCFKISVLGYDEAFKSAVAYRQDRIRELEQKYTERHGE